MIMSGTDSEMECTFVRKMTAINLYNSAECVVLLCVYVLSSVSDTIFA
jgi:hypothetical protein